MENEIAREMITSMHKQKFSEAMDECINKNLDFESAKMLKEFFNTTLNQIADAFIESIKKTKAKK